MPSISLNYRQLELSLNEAFRIKTHNTEWIYEVEVLQGSRSCGFFDTIYKAETYIRERCREA